MYVSLSKMRYEHCLQTLPISLNSICLHVDLQVKRSHVMQIIHSLILLIPTVFLIVVCSVDLLIFRQIFNSNIEIIERFQSKALCMIVDAPRYVPNTVIRDHHTQTVKEEIRRYSSQCSARLSAHLNGLAVNLMARHEIRLIDCPWVVISTTTKRNEHPMPEGITGLPCSGGK
jgi:hypothetical protein